METPCHTPNCAGEAIPGRRFCEPCAANLDRIRKELADDPKLLYNKRSDNSNRSLETPTPKRKRLATCKLAGCFEIRVPPDLYCFVHLEHQLEDDHA